MTMHDPDHPKSWSADEREIMRLKLAAGRARRDDPAWAAHIVESVELVEELRAEAGLAPGYCSRCQRPGKVGEMGWWEEIDGQLVCDGCITGPEIEEYGF